MEEGSEYCRWDELIPDALELIFRNLSLQDRLTVVPRVCKSWGRAVLGPYCWQEIDIEQWSTGCPPDRLDRMLQMLITRSCGSMRKLCVSGLRNEMLSHIALHAGSLQTLRLPRSPICDSGVEQIAGRLSTVTFLDVSYCDGIGAHALAAIGTHCKFLVGLCRNMHPLDRTEKIAQNDEAHAIATTMPKLKHLEMAFHLKTSTESVLKILSSCSELEFIDLRGCWDVELNEKFFREKFPKLKVSGPIIVEHGRSYWDDASSEYSDTSGYSAWEFLLDEMGEEIGDYDDDDSYDEMWDDEGRLEELELRFYEGIVDAGLNGLPPAA